MWTDAGTPHARACNACARPISPPSSVTAALLDMFCGLNGRTRSPRCAKARHRPATSKDFPTSEPVPCNIKAGTGRTLIPVSKLSFIWLYAKTANQNSTPICALMPCSRNGCLIIVISVTRSAASIRVSGALRPVRTTCWSGSLSAKAARTSSRGRKS